MIEDAKSRTVRGGDTSPWSLPAAIWVGMVFTLLSYLALNWLFPKGIWISLPLHSAMELEGAGIGLMLATILLSQQKALSSRRMWIVCALIAMAVLDAFHCSVPTGHSFVWLHSLAVLSGGLFFSLTCFPETPVSRRTALTFSSTVLFLAAIICVFSVTYPQTIPPMMTDERYTPLANAYNLTGGGLFLVAAICFTIRYCKNRDHEELLCFLLCLLFGGAAILFPLSVPWAADWWFRHLLRLGGYCVAFGLAMHSFRISQDELTRAHEELKSLFHNLKVG